jgi:aminopeptidase C
MIKAGHPVFFGCDVGKFSDKTAGIMDAALFEYEVRQAVLASGGNNETIMTECF